MDGYLGLKRATTYHIDFDGDDTPFQMAGRDLLDAIHQWFTKVDGDNDFAAEVVRLTHKIEEQEKELAMVRATLQNQYGRSADLGTALEKAKAALEPLRDQNVLLVQTVANLSQILRDGKADEPRMTHAEWMRQLPKIKEY